MTGQILLRAPSSNHHRRRQPLLENQSPSGSTRFAEVAGGTTAECAAVCCCCPCGLVNLLVLAVYKLPAGLCRKALRMKKRQQKLKSAAGLFPSQQQQQEQEQEQAAMCACGCQELHSSSSLQASGVLEKMVVEKPGALSQKEVNELEKEMWDRFYSTGFWRSPSQRD